LPSDRKKCILYQVEKSIIPRHITHSQVWNGRSESQNDHPELQNDHSTVQNNKTIFDAAFYLPVWAIYVSVLKRLSSLIGSQIL